MNLKSGLYLILAVISAVIMVGVGLEVFSGNVQHPSLAIGLLISTYLAAPYFFGAGMADKLLYEFPLYGRLLVVWSAIMLLCAAIVFIINTIVLYL